jgi:hypothetical protein
VIQQVQHPSGDHHVGQMPLPRQELNPQGPASRISASPVRQKETLSQG